MFEVSVERRADEELNAAAEFYESRESGLGDIFLDVKSVFDRVERISSVGSSLLGGVSSSTFIPVSFHHHLSSRRR